MPRQKPIGEEIPRFAIIGQVTGDFVAHVGLLHTSTTINAGDVVAVDDMMPPLNTSGSGRMRADEIAWLPLSTEQEVAIEEWLNDIASISSVIYRVCPAMSGGRNTSGRREPRRFSCAGFVHAAYAEACRIELVREEAVLELISEDLLREVWPDVFANSNPVLTAIQMRSVGLRQPGPWRILLPGYVLAALSTAPQNLPLLPKISDARRLPV